MKIQGMLGGGLALLVGWILCAQPASAVDYTSQVRDNQSKYQRPDDLIELIPFLGNIPRTLLFGDGYKMKLGLQDLRIDHMAYHSHAPAYKRDCMIGISYATPVAGFFTSRIDLPLFNAETPRFSDWGRSSFGDYVLYLSRGASDHSSVRLVLSAKF